MRRFGMKALFTVLNLDRADRTRIDWDHRVLRFSTAVTSNVADRPAALAPLTAAASKPAPTNHAVVPRLIRSSPDGFFVQ